MQIRGGLRLRAKYIALLEHVERTAAESWKRQYYVEGHGWKSIHSGDSEIIYKKLIALGDTPDPTAVDKIIGNAMWTKIRCGGCASYVSRAVLIGEGEEDAKSYCEVCLREAVSLLDRERD